eukprot:4543227-Amphidinium_carterae.2
MTRTTYTVVVNACDRPVAGDATHGVSVNSQPYSMTWGKKGQRHMMLKVERWNSLSLDRGSADSDGHGLAVPAGLTWLGKVCQTHSIDVLGVQESRMQSVSDHFKLNHGYTVRSVPASKTRGGLLLLMKESAHVKFVAMSVISERVLLVIGRLRGTVVNFIVGHAPVRHDVMHQHALKRSTPESLVSVLADLNLRVRGLSQEFSVVGPNALSTCRNQAAHGRPFARQASSRFLQAIRQLRVRNDVTVIQCAVSEYDDAGEFWALASVEGLQSDTRVIVDISAHDESERVPPVTQREVMASFGKISARKAATDKLHPTVYVAAKNLIGPVLAEMFNMCVCPGWRSTTGLERCSLGTSAEEMLAGLQSTCIPTGRTIDEGV